VRRLIVLSAAGTATALTAALVRRLSAGRAEQELWREVTDPV
jgi:hypothetical protein